MSPFLRWFLLAGCGIATIVPASPPQQKTSMAGSRAHASQATIEGLLRDVACPIQNLDSNATALSMKCVRDCVKGGSPLAILTRSGDLYLPISDKMPDEDQRQKLMRFVGKYVRASGTVFERNGTRAIVIAGIEEVRGVRLTLEGE